MTYLNSQKQGFALLMALIVVSVVVSVGLSVLDLTLKQLRLSTNSKDSEIVFHATNAGLECARYIRNTMTDDIEAGDDITPQCFGSGLLPDPSVSPEILDTNSGAAYLYEMDFTWDGTAAKRCSKIQLLAIVPTDDAATVVTAANISAKISGYPETENKICPAGGRCTIVSIQGFNRSCDDISSIGTLQREVLLEL